MAEVLQEVASLFPSELVPRIDFLITILQAVGWFIIFYIVFNVINTIINRKKNKEIERINKNLVDIKNLLRKYGRKKK